ncbi:MAG: Chromosome partition protein smc [Hydrogenibacillus schlegelii]|uniref:Chromosome partition protein Smc n=1 Tax=Hydrogenibacillus schlegelii TaxID=1484 RepID=A0A2T5GFE0_HYDSH|nr:chromosome segregation protein SMC [Hydrogenibacillus schlegelii]PTQ54903.1 MAG: Chromosome partition protein smc [Hydrogenibacillus schlegelii]
MHLKRVELYGFKSFAERTTIEFRPGIVAVVGPNGSGKSNLVDAVRWVLGEQSAQRLRGGKMDDVIFSGSEGRRPVNVAEVSLVLDNAGGELAVDYTEVAVTRRLFRTGESEYLLNGTPVRLKDIEALLVDVGLGREAAFIIGQGEIDAVLSQRPEERRALFETVAGIAKYKARRKEAERKLEETAHNLARVEDVYEALAEGLPPLQAEAKRAEAYLALKAEAEALERALLVTAIEADLAARDGAREAAERARAAERAAEERLAEAEAEAGRLAAAFEALEAELSALDADHLEAVRSAEALARDQAVATARAEALGRERASLERRLAALREEQAAAAASAAAAAREAAAAEAELDRLRAAAAELSAAAAPDDPAEALEALRSAYFDRLAAATEAEAEARRLRAAASRAAAALGRIEQEAARARAEEAEALQAFEAAEAAVREAAAAVEAKKRAATSSRAALAEARRAARQAEEARAAAAARLAEREAALRAFEAAQADFGLAEGARAVMAAARSGRLSGIHGPVALLFRVPDGLETAFDVALGAGAFDIVVDDEAAAHAAIRYLKEGRLGRATFLPLSVLRARPVPEALRALAGALDGVIGPAAELLEADGRYDVVRRYLLWNVLVVRTLDVAQAAARTLDYRYRIVTVGGELIAPGGSVTGGVDRRRRGGPFSVRGEAFRRLQAERAEAERALTAADAALADRRGALDAARAAAEEAAAALETAEATLREAEADRDRAARRLAAGREAVARAAAEVEVARAEAAELRAAAEETARRAAALRSAAEEALKMLRDQEAAAEALRAEAEARRDRRQALEVAIARAEARLQTLAEARSAAESRAAALDADVRRTRASLDALGREAAEMDGRARALAAALEAARAREAALAEAKAARYAEKEALRARLEAASFARSAAQAAVLEARTARADAEARLARAGEALDRNLRLLGERHRLTFEAARALHPPLDPEEAAAARAALAERTAALEAFGPVNVAAIEEARKLEERLSFYRAQIEDLRAGEAKLNTLIAEIDAAMRARFLEAVEAIRTAFRATFRALFGGGEADLRLEDGDPLVAGIEIEARPPGKRTKRLSLLSGGERALTAIALLFAALSVRPVPFCLLDEVDAALDEANVERFARYLQTLKDTTQWIVVTHRKGTMAVADALFGVTMDKSGASRLIAVALEDVERAAGAGRRSG